MAGAGLQPAGTSPAGTGTPAIAPANAGSVLRNANDGSTSNARSINAATRQYNIDANGRITGMTSTQQLVQLAVQTTLGLSAVKTLGNAISKVDRITDNFVRRVQDVYTAALSDLVARKLIAVNSIAVQQTQGSQAYVVIRWTDLSTNTEETIKL